MSKLRKTLAFKSVAKQSWGLEDDIVNKHAHHFPNGWLLSFLRDGESLRVCSNVMFCLENCDQAKECEKEGRELLKDEDNKESLGEKKNKKRKDWGTFQVKCGKTIQNNCLGK